MRKTEVEDSSFVKEILYNPERKVLEVRLKPNEEHPDKVYLYENVDENIYEEFISSNSKGRYFNEKVKGKLDTIEIRKILT